MKTLELVPGVYTFNAKHKEAVARLKRDLGPDDQYFVSLELRQASKMIPSTIWYIGGERFHVQGQEAGKVLPATLVNTAGLPVLRVDPDSGVR